jgi:hypothetical protein
VVIKDMRPMRIKGEERQEKQKEIIRKKEDPNDNKLTMKPQNLFSFQTRQKS